MKKNFFNHISEDAMTMKAEPVHCFIMVSVLLFEVLNLENIKDLLCQDLWGRSKMLINRKFEDAKTIVARQTASFMSFDE